MAPADIPSVPGIGVALPPQGPSAPSGPPAGGAGGTTPPAALADQADIRPLDIPGALQILIAEVRAALETTLLQAAAPTAAPPDPVGEALAALLPAGSDAGLPPQIAPPPTAPGAPAPPAPTAAPSLAAELDALLLPTLPVAPAATPGAASFGAAPLAVPDAAHQVVELLLQALPAETPREAALAVQLPPLLAALDNASAQALAIISSWRDVPLAARDAAQAATLLVANVFSEEPLQLIWLRPEWAGFLPRLEQFRRRRRRLKRRLEDPDARSPRREDEEPR